MAMLECGIGPSESREAGRFRPKPDIRGIGLRRSAASPNRPFGPRCSIIEGLEVSSAEGSRSWSNDRFGRTSFEFAFCKREIIENLEGA